MSLSKRMSLACAMTAMAATAGVPALAADADFSGKQITTLITSRPGGGTDTMGRVVGRMIVNFLPGKPDVIFRNVTGAGGIKALNYFSERVKPDGMTFVAGSGTAIWPDTLRKKAVRYNPATFIMIGSLPAPGSVVAVKKSVMPRFLDKSKKPVIMAGQSGTRGAGQMLVWGPNFLGWNVKWVVGYRGSAAIQMAFERGESQIIANYTNIALDPLVKSHCCDFVSQAGIYKNGKLIRRPDFPDVPLFSELVKGKIKTAQAKEAYEAWMDMAQVGKWYALPKGTPAAYVKAYRTAFNKMIATKEFDKTAKKEFSPVYTTQSGKSMDALVDRLVKITPAALNYIEKLRVKVGIPIGLQKKRHKHKKK